jgi:WD40 repeat protein
MSWLGIFILAFGLLPPVERASARADAPTQLVQITEIPLGVNGLGPVSFSVDGYLAAGYDGGIQVFQTTDWKLRKRIQLAYQVDKMAFSPDGIHLLAASHYTGKYKNAPFMAYAWETKTWKISSIQEDGNGRITALAWDAAGRIFALGREEQDKNDHALYLWYSNGSAQAALSAAPPASLAMAGWPHYLFSGGQDGYIQRYDLDSGELIDRLGSRGAAVTGLVYDMELFALAAGDDGGHVKVWQMDSRSPNPILDLDVSYSTGLAVVEYENWFSFCRRDGALVLAALADGSLIASDKPANGSCVDSTFSADGSLLAASFSDGTVRVYQTEGMEWGASPFSADPSLTIPPDPLKAILPVTPHDLPVIDKAAIHPANAGRLSILESGLPSLDGKYAASRPIVYEADGLYGQTIRAVHTGEGMELEIEGSQVRLTDTVKQTYSSLAGNGAKLTTAAFSPSGGWAAAGAEDGSVFMWDTVTGKPVCQSFNHPAQVKAVRFNHAESLLAVGYDDMTIELFSPTTCRRVARMPFTTRRINELVFSQDDRYLVSAAADTSAQVFQVSNQKLVDRIEPDHRRKGLFTLAYNPDQTVLAVGSYEGILSLFNASNGQFLVRVHVGTEENPITGLYFSPDGRHLFAFLKDRTWSVLGMGGS